MKHPVKALIVALVAVIALPSAAQELKVAVGLALPPYIIEGEDTGIEVEILQQCLPEGYKTKLIYVPMARLPVSLTDGTAEATLTINESSGIKNVFYSKSHVKYQNVVVTLKSRNLTVKSVADLSKLGIVAFQDATKYLGPEYAAMAKANPKYTELAAQENQVKMLFAGNTDCVVMDVNIYKYFKSKIKNFDVSKETVIHEIFPPTEYKVAFKSKALMERFNVALDKFRASGKYNELIAKYTR